ncbi:MAG: hypothetical protein ACLPN5_10715 [Roseiarcus sp.]
MVSGSRRSLQLCGRPGLSRSDGREVSWPKKAFLIALRLILEAPEAGLERSDLASFLWPHHGPERRAGNLRALLKRIHAAQADTGTFPLVEDAGRVRFDASAVDCDLVELQRAIASGDIGELARTAPTAARPLLEGFDDSGPGAGAWLAERRAGLAADFARAAGADPKALEPLARVGLDEGAGPAAPPFDFAPPRWRRPAPARIRRPLPLLLAASRIVVDPRLDPAPFRALVDDLVVRLWRTRTVRVAVRNRRNSGLDEPPAPTYRLRTSVSDAGGLRLGARLTSEPSGELVWAAAFALDFDRYDLTLASLVSAALSRLERHVVDRESGGGGADPSSFVLVARAFRDLERADLASLERARRRFHAALSGDGSYARAYSGAARSYLLEWLLRSGADPSALEIAEDCARRAIAIDSDDFFGHRELGLVDSFRRRPDAAQRRFERALELAPEHAGLRSDYAAVLIFSGAPDEGLRQADIADELGGASNDVGAWNRANGHLSIGDCRAALAAAHRMRSPNAAWRLRLVCHSLLGEIDEARRIAAAGLAAIEPDFSLDRWARLVPYARQEDIQRMIEGFRLAGLA